MEARGTLGVRLQNPTGILVPKEDTSYDRANHPDPAGGGDQRTKSRAALPATQPQFADVLPLEEQVWRNESHRGAAAEGTGAGEHGVNGG